MLQTLYAAGLSVTVTERGTLAVQPAGLITPELRQLITDSKVELIAQLTTNVVANAEDVEPPACTTTVGTPWCWPRSSPQITNEIGITQLRLTQFVRLGLPANTAGLMADRLLERDHEGDDRRVCLECQHLHGRPDRWRCGSHKSAGLGEAGLPGEWPLLLQRCPAFQPVIKS